MVGMLVNVISTKPLKDLCPRPTRKVFYKYVDWIKESLIKTKYTRLLSECLLTAL